MVLSSQSQLLKTTRGVVPRLLRRPRSHAGRSLVADEGRKKGILSLTGLSERHRSATFTTSWTAHVASISTCPFPSNDEKLNIVDDSNAGEGQQDESARGIKHDLEEVNELLVGALAAGDLPAVACAWARLRNMRPLTPGLVPLSYFQKYSELISKLVLQGKSFDPEAIQALDELAAFTVTHQEALCSRARHYLNNNNPNATLRIISMGYSLLLDRNSLLYDLKDKLSQGDFLRVIAVSGDACTLHFRSIAYAIAACVMKDSFHPMLGLGIHDKKLGASASQLMLYAAPLTQDLSLYGMKFRCWIRHYVNLRLFSREPTVFARYVTQIEASRNGQSLAHLADSIVPELSEDEPFLMLDSPAATGSVSRHSPIVLRDEHWAQLILSLIRARRVEDAERFWITMIGYGAKIPMVVWAAVIEGFGALKMFGQVQAAWNAFCSTQPTPGGGAVVYRAYIMTLFTEDRSKDALAVFEAFDKRIHKEHELNDTASLVSVYNVALEWLVQQSRVPEARQIFERMKASQPKPDVESYNIFIQHASRWQDLKAIAGIIREMQVLGMTSNIYTASILLAAVYPVRADAVELILALLRQAGAQVNTAACNSLLDHLVHLPNDEAIAAAVQLLEHMETSPDIQSNELSYVIVLSGIKRRVWENISLVSHYRHTVTAKMAQQQHRLMRSITMHNIIEACFEHPGHEGVRRTMMYYERYRKDRLRRSLEFDNSIWGTLLQQLSMRREWEIADELAREILLSGQTLPSGLLELLDQVRDRISDVAVELFI